MSLRKKALSIALAAGLYASAAASAARIPQEPHPRTDPPIVAQHQAPAQPAPQPATAPPTHQLPPQERGTSPGRETEPRPPRVDAPRQPVDVTGRLPRHHDPEHHARSWDRHDTWRTCRYDPWWVRHWSYWDTPRVGLWVGWPYWNVWGWENRDAYRAYERAGTVGTFEIMPPSGYDSAVVAYFQQPGERTVRVELARETHDGIALTVLRDDGADGTLEDAVEVTGTTRDDAQQRYISMASRERYRVPQAQADSLYRYLWDQVEKAIQDHA